MKLSRRMRAVLAIRLPDKLAAEVAELLRHEEQTAAEYIRSLIRRDLEKRGASSPAPQPAEAAAS